MPFVHALQIIVYPALAGLAAGIWRLWQMATAAKTEAAQARAVAAEALVIANGAVKELMEYRLYVAEHYAQNAYLKDVEDRLVRRLEGLHEMMVGNGEKMDEFMRYYHRAAQGRPGSTES